MRPRRVTAALKDADTLLGLAFAGAPSLRRAQKHTFVCRLPGVLSLRQAIDASAAAC